MFSHQQFYCLQIQTTPWESKFALRSLRASMSCQSFSSTINTITRKKTWKLIRKYFTAKSRVDIGSASLELIVKPRHISKADILKGCSLDLSQLTCKPYQTYFDSHLAYGYLSVITLYLRLSKNSSLKKQIHF